MDNETLVELIKRLEGITVRQDMMMQSNQKLEERMARLETLREQDIKQNEKIEQILTRLEQGNSHFDVIDGRLNKLEAADGEKAKGLQKQVVGMVVAAVVGAIIGNIGGILHWLGGGN